MVGTILHHHLGGSYVYQSWMNSSSIQFQQIYRMLFLSPFLGPLGVLFKKKQGPKAAPPGSSASSADSDASAASSSSAKASVLFAFLGQQKARHNLDRSDVRA